jgi:hypothetical protein
MGNSGNTRERGEAQIMLLQRLIKLVTPPERAYETGSKSEWARVEKQLGAPLPADYKEFIGRYGSGLFAGLYYVFNPFSASSSFNLFDQLKELGEYYQQEHAGDEDEYPYDVFPKKPGLLPWGHDNEGNTYFWLVKPKAKPDDWPVIFFEPRGGGFEEFKQSMSGYLAGVLEGKIPAPVQNYPSAEVMKFEPAELPAQASPEALLDAIQRNDVALVKELLDSGVDPNSDVSGQRMLSVATNHQDLAIAKLLLSRGADINGDPSLLFFTAQSGDAPVLDFLLNAGADPNMKRPSGAPALFAAAGSGSAEMVRALLAKGADPNATDKRGNTSIFMAITENDVEIIRILINNGTNLAVRDAEGRTPLEFAREKKRNVSLAALEEAAKSGKRK